MSDKEQAVDMAQAWGPYTTDSEKDEIETETWDLDAIKVWPAGKSGPAPDRVGGVATGGCTAEAGA